MDQSTQVSFPVVSRSQHRNMRRHNTSLDLFHSHPSQLNLSQPRSLQIVSSNWSAMRSSPRTKSMNLSAEFASRSRVSYNDMPLHNRLSSPISETQLSITRERTPPFSSSSSIVSNGHGYKPPPYVPPKFKLNGLDDENSSGCSKCCCRCNDGESLIGTYKQIPKHSPEGLSWRKLHMSRAKLKATATTSELLSGFAMIAMVELQINTPTSVPEWLFVMFAVCTTVLVAVHIFALMISTYILPNIEAVAKLEICEMVAESPHERMRGFIELAWAFSTVLGLFLFLVEVAILCWVKFWDYSFTAAIAATIVVIPVLITFILFAVHFYHSLVVYKCDASLNDMEKLEDMKKQLDEVTSPVVINVTE